MREILAAVGLFAIAFGAVTAIIGQASAPPARRAVAPEPAAVRSATSEAAFLIEQFGRVSKLPVGPLARLVRELD